MGAGTKRQFAGLIFGHQLGGTIGQFVKDLELIALASESDEWMNAVEYIPYLGRSLYTSIKKTSSIWDLGTNPVECDVNDGAINHDIICIIN
ncbi:hypothetical protein BCD67_02820 [Oscillatoriales cyanobacterium USR001]|nr:hypothetical protein BCD67_02820 [Oscillatoriales cyanobacterium USR001]